MSTAMSFSPVLCSWYLILSPENTPLCGAAHSDCSFCICVCFSYLQKEHHLTMKAVLLYCDHQRQMDRNALLLLSFSHAFCFVFLFFSPSSARNVSGFFQLKCRFFFFLTFQAIYFCLNQNILEKKDLNFRILLVQLQNLFLLKFDFKTKQCFTSLLHVCSQFHRVRGQ